MKKEQNKTKEIIGFILLVFIYIFSCIITKNINNLDELWNYSFAKNIANSLIPYKDFNIIVTPFIYYISGIILKIFGQELIVIRVITAILNTGVFVLIFKILSKLIDSIKEKIKIETKTRTDTNSISIPIIITTILIFLFKDFYVFDYNVVFILFTLIIIYLEIKQRNNTNKIFEINIKLDIIIGLLIGLAILTKQSVGIVLAFASLGYKLLIVKNKQELKEYFKIVLSRILGILIPILMFIIYLIITKSFISFIDYAILGISTFSNHISYINLFKENIVIKILAILVPFSLIYMLLSGIKKRKIQKRKIENDINLIIFTYSIATIMLCYPIADKIHFLLGTLVPIIGIIYNCALVINKKILNDKEIRSKKENKEDSKIINNNEIIKIILSTICIALLIYVSILNIFKYTQIEYKSTLNNFKYIGIDKKFEDEIKQIDEYILKQKSIGNKVYILDAAASVYMLPINIYNKDYDLFLKGNLGKLGEQGQIEKIGNSKENKIYLIKNEQYSRNWQNPELVRKYIINNLENIGQIGVFDIYSKK